MGYRELAGAYSHIPPTLLPRLMSKALQGKRSSSGLLQGLGSLLSKGSLLIPNHNTCTCKMT